jgi:hypothetical protein
MVARTRPEAELVVIFQRHGEDPETRIVPDGHRAAKTAILMIASRDALHGGRSVACPALRRGGLNGLRR